MLLEYDKPKNKVSELICKIIPANYKYFEKIKEANMKEIPVGVIATLRHHRNQHLCV